MIMYGKNNGTYLYIMDRETLRSCDELPRKQVSSCTGAFHQTFKEELIQHNTLILREEGLLPNSFCKVNLTTRRKPGKTSHEKKTMN